MKVLIAEDDPVSLSCLRGAVEDWGYEVCTATDGKTALNLLQQSDAPMLAILDWMMPGMDGIDVCRNLRTAQRDIYTYLIMLTHRTEVEFTIEAMNAGADDFIGKPYNLDELQVRLRAGTRIIELQQELRLKATRDALTDIYNRGAILAILEKEIARHQRDGKALAVLFADLDHFKQVNDTYGHLAGDAVLRAVTQRIAKILRPYDSQGRYGGEELLLTLPACSHQKAAEVAERIRKKISDSAVETSFGVIAVSVSIGVTVLAPHECISMNALLQRADEALYRAKNNGRNRVEIAR